MTATDELRRMLDERGVEWWQSVNMLGCVFTRWYSPLFSDEVVAMENGDGELELFSHLMTPEQAIAATLGPAYGPPVAMHWNGDVLTLTIPRDPSCIRVQRSAEQPCKVYADESKVIAATLGNDGVGRTNDGLDDLQAENAKLRELVADVHEALCSDKAGIFHELILASMEDDMRELGVEVD